MKIVVGLGNPGKRYMGTRHNVGFDVVDALAKRARISIKRSIAQSLVGEGMFAGQYTLFVKPQTFMNLSGSAINDLARRFKVNPSDIIVIFDDLDLPVGRLRIRSKGSSGGHKGAQSIIDSLRSNEFPRIRIGIGSSDIETADYVLSRFNSGERELIDNAVLQAADAVEMALAEGIETSMNKFNVSPAEDPEPETSEA